MAADGKKGITVKVDAALHAEITQYLQDHGMTMTEFVTLALQDELHPKIDEKEGKNMEKMRTLAFQVPESLFQRIKDYLHRNNMTQKDFVIGLIEQELDRDLAESQETGEAQGDFEDTEELADTEQLDAAQELPGDPETASSVEEMEKRNRLSLIRKCRRHLRKAPMLKNWMMRCPYRRKPAKQTIRTMRICQKMPWRMKM